MAEFAGYPGDVTWSMNKYPVTPVQQEALEIVWSLLTGLASAKATLTKTIVIASRSQNPINGDVTMNLFHHVITVERNGHIVARKEEDASEV